VLGEKNVPVVHLTVSMKEAWKLPLRATVRQEVHGEDKWRWEVLRGK
jgi:hypothetical protein